MDRNEVSSELIRLLEHVQQMDQMLCDNESCGDCKGDYAAPFCFMEQAIEFLMNNGVTIRQWTPVETMPKKEGWYHVAILDIKTGKYQVENDLYAVEIAKQHGHKPGFCKANRWPERERLTHWQPYPDPPPVN